MMNNVINMQEMNFVPASKTVSSSFRVRAVLQQQGESVNFQGDYPI